MIPKIYIAIIGKTCAGKETVYKIIGEEASPRFTTAIHHFSDPLNEILDILLLPRERSNQQWLSTILRQKFGEELLGRVIKRRALADSADIIVLDGVRRPQDVMMLRELPNSFLVLTAAPMEERFRRLKARADRPGDAEKTWEAFQAEQSAEAESMIDEIGKEADIYLDNSGTIEELRSQVRGFMNTGEEFNVCWLAVKDAIIYKNKPKSA